MTKRLIETNNFPFEFLSQLAERESYRKDIFRPVYYLHKWWAKRLGSVFRGILLGSVLPENANLPQEFFKFHSFSNLTVFDPFMGSGVTIGEAHKLGFTALGRDINPVAYEMVRISLGPLERGKLEKAFETLSTTVGKKILSLYHTENSLGEVANLLYYFWVMQTSCPNCHKPVDLFPSWIIGRNAYPKKKPEIHILCPRCNTIFPSVFGQLQTTCVSCGFTFSPDKGITNDSNATCTSCGSTFSIIESIQKEGSVPHFRIIGKLILNSDGKKEYLKVSNIDIKSYEACSLQLNNELQKNLINLPTLQLEKGYNTQQAMNYGFNHWRDFFNNRQLLALSWLQKEIIKLDEDSAIRDALFLLFSGILEFNNMFTSYKGEGTGAVRHMFSHHILKPEKTPIEANVWGIPKSSGSFSTLFKRRLLKAIEYRNGPTEIDLSSGGKKICSPPFSGKIEPNWPIDGIYSHKAIYLSCGDSTTTGLQCKSIDIVVTDPPFFDNVNYSELADFFYAWQQLYWKRKGYPDSTRNGKEVQDSDSYKFSRKLQNVMTECNKILKDDGLFIFTYHHSKDEGWIALIMALLNSGFIVVNAHPVKSEMSVATPKSQAKEPIQLDNIIVCKKNSYLNDNTNNSILITEVVKSKIKRLRDIGLNLSRNDYKVVYYGQKLMTINLTSNIEKLLQFTDDDFNHLNGNA